MDRTLRKCDAECTQHRAHLWDGTPIESEDGTRAKMSDDPQKPIRDQPVWYVTWLGCILAWVVIGGIIALLVIAYAYDGGDGGSQHGKFWCNDSTGVYESRDGKQVVPIPYDPACHKVDEP